MLTRDPTACMALLELLQEAGLPDGVVNVIHGQHETVNFICDHPDIRAVSFVGGDAAGKHIYERGSSNGGFWGRGESSDIQGRESNATWERRTTV